MPTFAHDPRRIHPPYTAAAGVGDTPPPHGGDNPQPLPSDGGPSSTAEETRTRRVYQDGPVLVSLALGGTGEPHRIVWVGTQRRFRNQGLARAQMALVIADLDADAMECVTIINNVEPDVDVPRMTGFFESFGFVLEMTDPHPTLRRPPTPAAPSST